MASKPYDMDRLGGPPGLYDSSNWDRESTGGIVQRVRVPDAPGDVDNCEYMAGKYNPLSLNDSDSCREPNSKAVELELAKIREQQLECGIPYRESISGCKR